MQIKQESVRPRWPYDMRPSVRAEKYIRDASGWRKDVTDGNDNGTDRQTDRQSATQYYYYYYVYFAQNADTILV